MSKVITGFLLEYYSGGSLEQILERNEVLKETLVAKWAIQIGEALQLLHLNDKTHLDIKASNVVLGAQENAILIDISGTGGFVFEWLSPEMQTAFQHTGTLPTQAPFEERVATDCWAYGRLLSILAPKCSPDGGAGAVQYVACCLTKSLPEDRISLDDALAELQRIVDSGLDRYRDWETQS